VLISNESELPTKANISLALKDLSRSSLTSSDLAIFFFAGHGFSADSEDYITSMDTETDKKDTGVSTKDVLESLQSSGAGTSILLVDVCRVDLGRAPSRFGERTTELARRQGTIVFLSCSPGEISHELPSLEGGHGLFTYALIQAFRNNISTTPIQLARYINGLVGQLCRDHKLGVQRPYASAFPIESALLDIIDGSYREIAGRKRRNMIVIVGPSNAGKTTLGQRLSSELKYTHIEMSSFVWKRLVELDLSPYTVSVPDAMENMIWNDQSRLDCIAADMLESTKELDNVIVCGARRTEEIDSIRSSNWRVIPFFLYSDSATRYRRTAAERPPDYASFVKGRYA
jgi:shikimate kinase